MSDPFAPLGRALVSRVVRYLLIDVFTIEDVEIPTARLTHIVISKQAAGREKDHLFRATHRDALEQLLKKPGGD